MDIQSFKETKKLHLILDLDHTLLHTIRKDMLHPSCSLDNFKDVYQFKIESDADYCVKFRPGIVKFLEKISKFFHIHIYTMGTRDYANMIIQIIINQLMNGFSVFNGKILTRSDTGKDIKNLSSILPGEEHLTLILDDSPYIWYQFKHHVIPIYPYKYFKTVTETPLLTPNPEDNEVEKNNHSKGNKSSIIGSPHDNHLRSMYNVLASVHRHFFYDFNFSGNLNIKQNLKWRRKKVLSGVHILFSGVFPLGTKPREQSLWKNAKYYGAVCYERFNDNITHLVAARKGTEKVLEAERRGTVFIVSPNWIYYSLAHWIRLPENNFNLMRIKGKMASRREIYKSCEKKMNTKMELLQKIRSTTQM
jgi:FCP1-like phosphatase family protein